MSEKTKKIVFLGTLFLSLLVYKGVFYWKNNKELEEINKTLPQGISLKESLNGNLRLINKIDNYQFTIPDHWKGVENVSYATQWEENNYSGKSLSLKGKEGNSRILSIDRYEINDPAIVLKEWAENIFISFGLNGNFKEEGLGSFNVVKTKENDHLFGMSVYFFKTNSFVYVITNGSEDYIKDIITKGKWE